MRTPHDVPQEGRPQPQEGAPLPESGAAVNAPGGPLRSSRKLPRGTTPERGQAGIVRTAEVLHAQLVRLEREEHYWQYWLRIRPRVATVLLVLLLVCLFPANLSFFSAGILRFPSQLYAGYIWLMTAVTLLAAVVIALDRIGRARARARMADSESRASAIVLLLEMVLLLESSSTVDASGTPVSGSGAGAGTAARDGDDQPGSDAD